MSTETKRTRLSAVYLTATERDLVVQAMDVLLGLLHPQTENHINHSASTKFARSHTSQRIRATQALFKDKPAGAHGEQA